MHVFAHNGDLKNLETSQKIKLGRYHPLGETDSEYAFCFLMNLMEELWTSATPPQLEARLEVIAYFADTIRNLGSGNFIYFDSEILFIHGHKSTRKDSQDIFAPGLFTLCRTCSPEQGQLKIKGLDLALEVEQQKVLLAASIPLTNENWIPLAEGEIQVLANGSVLAEVKKNSPHSTVRWFERIAPPLNVQVEGNRPEP
jgi:glutamine amidotransferase